MITAKIYLLEWTEALGSLPRSSRVNTLLIIKLKVQDKRCKILTLSETDEKKEQTSMGGCNIWHNPSCVQIPHSTILQQTASSVT
jgi:hypothetical protein